VGDNRDGFRLAAVYARVNAVRALVSAHGWVLVFLQPLPGTVEFGCYGCVRLGYVLIERLVPAKVNQGRDDQNFSQ
jgi:hypothetical protein